MAIDHEIENAIKEVVRRLGQPERVSKILIAWLIDSSNRDLSHSDNVEHLVNLRDAIELED